MSWAVEFATPIELPDGGRLRSLKDARDFLNKLRGAEAGTVEWQCAIEAVLMVVETGCPTDIARAALVEAIRRHSAPISDASGSPNKRAL